MTSPTQVTTVFCNTCMLAYVADVGSPTALLGQCDGCRNLSSRPPRDNAGDIACPNCGEQSAFYAVEEIRAYRNVEPMEDRRMQIRDIYDDYVEQGPRIYCSNCDQHMGYGEDYSDHEYY